MFRTCVVALLLAARPVGAQPAGTASAAAPLTVDEAVREALDRNLTLIADRYSVDVAQARILTAKLRPNPVFTYDAMIPDSAIYDRNVNPFENVFRADVLFEGGGKRARRIEVAQEAKSVAALQLLDAMRTIRLDVERAFVDVLLAKANVALARDSLNAFNAIVAVNTERVRTGDLAGVELARTRLAALQFENDVRQQESRLVVARNHLKALLGRTGPGDIDVVGDLRRDEPPATLDALRARALAARPDLEALRRDQARSLADIRLQIAEGKIDYTLSGEFHRQQAPNALGNQYGLYVSVPVPIFNRNQGEVERARQESRQLDARVTALSADISTEVAAAYEEFTTARDVVQRIEKEMLDQARDVRTTTEYSYRRGEASFVEFLDAVRAFNETMQSYNDARADYARSLYELDAISGGVTP